MLTKKNKGKLIPLHVAIQAGNLDVINEMLRYADPSLLNVCDDQQRTSLHMAAAKGEKVFYLECGR
jgi:ankyrin repeat protein